MYPAKRSVNPLGFSVSRRYTSHSGGVPMPSMYNRGWSEPPHTEGHHPDMPETLPEPFQRSAFPTPPIQLQISSLSKISSICAVNVFISPTQRMGARAFSSSVTPAASIMRGSMASIRSRAARSISNRCGYSFSLKIKLL